MKLKRISILLFFIFFILEKTLLSGCTTAVISPKASMRGTPIIWKNRDTGFLSNKVIFVKEEPYSYIGVVNSSNRSGRQVWAGLNEKGFAIINSVAYNLPKNEKEIHDLEGIVMADALRKCRSVEEFEEFLSENLGPDLGVQTNFGVIDDKGNSAIFEVHNHGYKKLDTKDFSTGYIVNTNFSRSGEEGEGAGYLRFDRASYILNKIKDSGLTPEKIISNLSRDFGHTLLKHPTLNDLGKISSKNPCWILTKDTIERSYTSASIIIEGKNPEKTGSVATMWVILGEPLTSIALPFWVESHTTPEELFKGKDSEIYSESFRIRKLIRPFQEAEKIEYIDLSRLVNKERTGYLPIILAGEHSIIKETEKFLESGHKAEEYAGFQQKMVLKALKILKSIK